MTKKERILKNLQEKSPPRLNNEDLIRKFERLNKALKAVAKNIEKMNGSFQ